jgi:hypothetical protein
MTLQEIIVDIHALNEDLEMYERKYGVLSDTFYEAYVNGEEPENDAWVLDWADWQAHTKSFCAAASNINVPFRNCACKRKRKVIVSRLESVKRIAYRHRI